MTLGHSIEPQPTLVVPPGPMVASCVSWVWGHMSGIPEHLEAKTSLSYLKTLCFETKTKIKAVRLFGVQPTFSR